MSKKETKKKLVGPWRTLHVVIWLVGLYLLFTREFFFPGILILIAVSALYEGLLSRFAPHAFEEETSLPSTVVAGASPMPAEKMTEPGRGIPPLREHDFEHLPQFCPGCNAPVRGHEVRWTGSQSANCAYCGTNLPMKIS